MARKASTYIGDDSQVEWGRVYTHEEIAEHMGLTKIFGKSRSTHC